MTNNDKNGVGGKAVVGFTLVAAAAAAAGTYFLYGEKGAKNRKIVKGWILRAKGEVLERIENLKQIDEDTYNKVVDTVAKRYQAMKNVDTTELAKMVEELKSHWKSISKQIMPKELKRSAKKSSPKKK